MTNATSFFAALAILVALASATIATEHHLAVQDRINQEQVR